MNVTIQGVPVQDVLRIPHMVQHDYTGCVGQAVHLIRQAQLLNRSLWRRFVQQFREQDADSDNGWRGEYWGKMMMGACFLCQMTEDDALYAVLEETVRDMLSVQDEHGRIATYATGHELHGWDLWCRKYVMLGMEYFLEFCQDSALSGAIIESLCKQMDAILEKAGPGKTPICEASDLYRGLNSSSILEPVVLLYRLTKKTAYLDLARHIVSCGGTSICDLYTLALQDDFYPYQYPVTKAYEMISCFEGLIELWRATGDEACKKSALQFTDKLLESDFTIIGSCGCTHEFLDHSTVRQANEGIGPLMQETCVTVSVMKLLWQATRLTGDMRYIDAFERSFYNAYLGSINTNKIIPDEFRQEHPDLALEALPFDSYSPLTSGYRGRGVGGFQVMSDGHYYGCCACIGATGCGLFSKLQLLETDGGFVLSLYEAGTALARTPQGQNLRFVTKTDYPSSPHVALTVYLPREEHFRLILRIPSWSVQTEAALNGTPQSITSSALVLDRVWKNGDCITLDFDFHVRFEMPVSYGHDILMTNVQWEKDYVVPVFDREPLDAQYHIAFMRGPLTLAAQQSLSWTPGQPVRPLISKDGSVAVRIPTAEAQSCNPHLAEIHLLQQDVPPMVLMDYASAGKQWGSSDYIAAWLPTQS